jgi:hypothetical protein
LYPSPALFVVVDSSNLRFEKSCLLQFEFLTLSGNVLSENLKDVNGSGIK